MKPTIVEHQQGTDSWHKHRASHLNASELAAAMGASKYKSRADFIKERATGITPEIDDATQRRFDKGHEFEAIARLWAEELIGDELFPLVLAADVDGLPLSASLDGQTMLGTVIWEHKTGSASLLESLELGVIPPEYHPQLEQQMMLSGAEKCLFMASSGTRETERHAWYESSSELRAKIIPTWVQFLEDLENYVHIEVIPAAIAAPQMSLPSVSIQVQGSIALIDNLDVFGEALTAYVERINKKPETDQDFADLEATVKTLKTAEEALDAAENSALGQAASIDTMRRTVALYRALARDNRLMIGKLVETEKQNRRGDIIRHAQDVMILHIDGLNQRVGGFMPRTIYPFAEAIKGLKSIDSMRDKVSAALANAKIEASEIADRIAANQLEMTGELDWSFLFPDFAAVCIKARDDFSALLMARIAKHNEAQAAKDKAAKDAEDARIAAAVETERKAGEARAAAAVEAERMAEAKRVADVQVKAREEADRITREAARADAQAKVQAATDQRAKTEPAGESFPAIASWPPISAKEAVAAWHDLNDDALIDDFLKLLEATPSEKKSLRVHLVKFVRYQAACEVQAMV